MSRRTSNHQPWHPYPEETVFDVANDPIGRIAIAGRQAEIQEEVRRLRDLNDSLRGDEETVNEISKEGE